jgi:hypothetical protein
MGDPSRVLNTALNDIVGDVGEVGGLTGRLCGASGVKGREKVGSEVEGRGESSM